MGSSLGTSTLTLDARELVRALEVLETEQNLFVPTRAELGHARLLFALTVAFAAIVAAAAILLLVSEGSLWVVPYPLNGILVLMAAFFYLNLGLLRKLWNLETLRRQSNLSGLLSSRFRAEWRRNWARNIPKIVAALVGLSLLVVPLGYLLMTFTELPLNAQLPILSALGLAALAVYLWRRFARKLGKRFRWIRRLAFFLLIIALAPFVIVIGVMMLVPFVNLVFTVFPGGPLFGACLITLYLIGRGKQRLEVVAGLHDKLANVAPQEGAGSVGGMEIPTDVYQAIAGLERNQIVLARRQSIRAGTAEEADSGYVILKSRPARAALDGLDSATRMRVDEAIFQLTREPRPHGAMLDESSGRYRLPVAETPVEIDYAVEPEAGRVRIYSIAGVGEGTEPAT